MELNQPRRGRPPRAEQRAPQRAPLIIRTHENRFEIAPGSEPEGMTYEWKARTVMGQDQRTRMANYVHNGWSPVPAGRHPELSGASEGDESEINIDGQVLMERATELTNQIREMDTAKAHDQVDTQFERLQIQGRESGYKKTKIQRKMMAVEDDA